MTTLADFKTVTLHFDLAGFETTDSKINAMREALTQLLEHLEQESKCGLPEQMYDGVGDQIGTVQYEE